MGGAVFLLGRLKMAKNKEKEQLRLLNCGDALELSKLRKRTKLKEAGSPSRSDAKASGEFFDNLITTEELAIIFRVSPQTIRNWVARRKIPYVQVGRRNLFQVRRLQQWLNQKEEPLWE